MSTAVWKFYRTKQDEILGVSGKSTTSEVNFDFLCFFIYSTHQWDVSEIHYIYYLTKKKRVGGINWIGSHFMYTHCSDLAYI